MGMKQLGTILKEARSTRGWSLRDAEAKTGISNGYLYLLEQSRINDPSPRKLMQLANAYALEYQVLMLEAGYLQTGRRSHRERSTTGIALSSAIKDMNEAELREVQKFVKFIRSQKKKKK